MKTELYDLEGKKIKDIELPSQFTTDYEPILVKRALLVIQYHQKPYGSMYGAGFVGVSGKISRRRRNYKGSYGHGISRVPRKTLWRRGTQFGWVGTEAPGTVKGRRAHPPKSEKQFELKINKKERKKAIRSALSGVAQAKKMKVVEAKFETLKKSKDLKAFMTKLMAQEVARLDEVTIRAGKGKKRGRRYQTKKGPLLVVADKCAVQTAAKNLPGIDVVAVKNLNVEVLTRGTELRPSVWTENAVKKLELEKLFQ